jgi:hypothetical protein
MSTLLSVQVRSLAESLLIKENILNEIIKHYEQTGNGGSEIYKILVNAF